jgi:MYXO-CTERM domain-containing protein
MPGICHSQRRPWQDASQGGPHVAEVLGSIRCLVLAAVLGGAALANAQQISTQVRDIQQGAPGSSPTGATSLDAGRVIVFAASDGPSGLEPWRTDGSAAGTYRLRDTRPGAVSGLTNPVRFMATASKVFFVAGDETTGFELWASDGTVDGTLLVKDIRPGATGSSPLLQAAIGDTLYFYASDGTTGIELWKSDGTADGTTLVKDLRPGPNSGPQGPMLRVGNTLFFPAYEATTGVELWKSDGTADGTVLVRDIFGGAGSSAPRSIASAGGTVFLIANDGSTGEELWKSDGTEAGTTLVSDLAPGGEPGLAGVSLVAGPRAVFFSANLGGLGEEPWASDGTAAGTVLLRDIVPGAESSGPRLLTATDGQVFFFAEAPGQGVELWKSDGTPEGTVLVRDIRAGRLDGLPVASEPFMMAVGGKVLFAADDGVTGIELWKSDGTERGTLAVEDRVPGRIGAAPLWALPQGDGLLVAQNDGMTGDELWWLPGWSLDTTPPDVTPRVSGTAGANGFYTSDVSVSWEAADADSPLLDSSQCDTTRVTTDTAETTLTCTVISGGGTSRVSVVIKRDTTAPSITCPATWTTGGRSSSEVPVSYPPATAQDAIDPAPVVTYSRAAGTRFPLGTTSVTATATDAAGLTASCTFDVRVEEDGEPPAVTCPSDITAPATGKGGASVTYPAASVSDALDSQPTLEYSRASGATFPVGATTVTVTARDAAGNASTCSFQVTVTSEPTVPPPEDDSGCACRTSSSPGAAPWLVLVLLTLFVSRRARRDARSAP